MKKLIFIPVLLLMGCAFNNIENGLQALQGMPLTYAIGKLGYPDAETKIAGNDVYIWHVQNAGTTIVPVTSPSYGTFTNAYGGYANYSGSTTSYVPQSYNYECTIRLIASEGQIIGGDYDGNIGGCNAFSRAMAAIAQDSALSLAGKRQIAIAETCREEVGPNAPANDLLKCIEAAEANF